LQTNEALTKKLFHLLAHLSDVLVTVKNKQLNFLTDLTIIILIRPIFASSNRYFSGWKLSLLQLLGIG